MEKPLKTGSYIVVLHGLTLIPNEPPLHPAGQDCREIEGSTNHLGNLFGGNAIIGISPKYRFIERIHRCPGR